MTTTRWLRARSRTSAATCSSERVGDMRDFHAYDTDRLVLPCLLQFGASIGPTASRQSARNVRLWSTDHCLCFWHLSAFVVASRKSRSGLPPRPDLGLAVRGHPQRSTPSNTALRVSEKPERWRWVGWLLSSVSSAPIACAREPSTQLAQEEDHGTGRTRPVRKNLQMFLSIQVK